MCSGLCSAGVVVFVLFFLINLFLTVENAALDPRTTQALILISNKARLQDHRLAEVKVCPNSDFFPDAFHHAKSRTSADL